MILVHSQGWKPVMWSCVWLSHVFLYQSGSCELVGRSWAVFCSTSCWQDPRSSIGVTGQAAVSKMAHSHGLSAESSDEAVSWNISVDFSPHSSWFPRGSVLRANVQKGPGNQSSYNLALVVSDVTPTIFCRSGKSLRPLQMEGKVNQTPVFNERSVYIRKEGN